MSPETIAQMIQAGLPGAQVEVFGDDGVHFEALIVHEAFAGKLPLARHRMVYATLGDKMKTDFGFLVQKPVVMFMKS